MDSKSNENLNKRPVGVIGSGSFGTVVSNLLAENGPTILYSRRPEVVEEINKNRFYKGQQMHDDLSATDDVELICSSCDLIFPSVPSANFREMMQTFSPFLGPNHILIHCTKGFDIRLPEGKDLFDEGLKIKPKEILSMSEVILEESSVLRVGCLSGPNLSGEIANRHPAAAVIASKFDEVIALGQAAIRSKRFQIYGSRDIIGVELGGVLKNIMAIAAGGLSGMGYGQNALSFLISRGLSEIVRLGSALGAEPQAFLGLAGIGDLIATCTSPLSRNFTVGLRLAQGETLDYILETSEEVAEGVKTTRICKKLADSLGLKVPLITTIYNVLFKDLDVKEALQRLMEYRWGTDVDFL